MGEAADLYRAKTRYFYFPKPGEPVLVLEGAIARKGHKVIEQTPDNWEPLTVDYEVKTRATRRDDG
jgi:hypothetical protein